MQFLSYKEQLKFYNEQPNKLIGENFGRAIVKEYIGKDSANRKKYKCLCNCGNIFITDIYSILNGHTCSCGCLRKEATIAFNTTHGQKYTRLYTTWGNMINRCNNLNNPHYDDYGGRGIKVCNEWLQFENFYNWAIQNGYSDTLTIDRINNNKGYMPENCRWITLQMQSRNRRSNHMLTYNGITKSMTEWSEETGISFSAIKTRLKRGWDIEKTLTIPMRSRQCNKEVIN